MARDDHDDQIRRLLAEARHDEPMPPEVVARLDDVLAELGREPARVAPVADLATRRRRATRLLVAAAAVVVIGVGVQQVLDPGSDSSASQTDAGATGADSAEELSVDGEKAEGIDQDRSSPAEAAVPAPAEDARGGKVFRLRRQHMADDVTRLRARAQVAQLADSPGAGYTADDACEAGDWGEGTFVPVRYGSTPAVLVFRRPMGDTQVADLFLCGEAEPFRSVTLPAP